MERTVRLVFESREQYESQRATIESIAGEIGCAAETLRRWVRQQERNTGQRSGPTTAEQESGAVQGSDAWHLARLYRAMKSRN